MYDEVYFIEDKLPPKGKDIKAIDAYGDIYHCFRCNCINPYCKDFRCSITGLTLLVKIVKWYY